jgi:hypothetical protein
MIEPNDSPAATKIVAFPKRHADFDAGMPESLEEAKNRVVEYKTSYNLDCAEMCYEHTLHELRQMGFITGQDPTRYNENDFVLLFEAIRSIMDRYQRIPNDLHKVVDDLFVMIDESEDQDESEEITEKE